MIVSDTPQPEFEGRNEVLLDGESVAILRRLAAVAERAPAFAVGDATSVLIDLEHL